jgi:hypothetical protein
VTITTRGRGAGQDQLPTTEGMGEH